MNAYESVALNEFLSSYPNDKTYDEVLELLLNEDEDVIVWQSFDRDPAEFVYDCIESLRRTLKQHFIPRKENM